jgi:hypothetical protein
MRCLLSDIYFGIENSQTDRTPNPETSLLGTYKLELRYLDSMMWGLITYVEVLKHPLCKDSL